MNTKLSYIYFIQIIKSWNANLKFYRFKHGTTSQLLVLHHWARAFWKSQMNRKLGLIVQINFLRGESPFESKRVYFART